MGSDHCYFDSLFCQFLDLWNSMNIITRGSMILLITMLLVECRVIAERWFRFYFARRQSRKFIERVQEPLRSGEVDAALAIAQRFRYSHLARLLKAGLNSCRSAPADLSDQERLEWCCRALRRAEDHNRELLKANVRTLRTISSTAPFVGLMGTVFGIFNAFRGYSGSKATWLRMIAFEMSEALVPTAAGLLVAILAVWFHNYFCERLEVFGIEMSNAALEFKDWVCSHPPASATPSRESDPILAIWDMPYDFQRLLLFEVAFCELYLVYIFGVSALR